MVFNQYPYTNFHDLNMDWILKEMKVISEDIITLNEWKKQREERDEWLDESIEDLNRKYAELMLLYNSFVESVNLRFKELSDDITQQVDDLELRITRQVDDLETRITNQVNILEANLIRRMNDFESEVNALLAIYNGRIIQVEQDIVRVENMIPALELMIDPYTGQENTIVNVIYEIVNQSKPNALTAAAYDAFGKTAAQYDALALSAYDYDFNGALYIS